MRETVFLEFYGLPGSGKSTLSHLFAEELRNRKNTVKEPTYYIDHNYNQYFRKTIKLLKYIRYMFCHPIRNIQLIQCVIRNGYRGVSIISQCSNIAQKLWFYDHAHSDYVVFDEGLTQSAISLSYTEKINIIENEKILYSLCKKRATIKIYICISVEEAKKRLTKRNTHNSRIERIIGNEQQDNKMKIIQAFCRSISSDVIIYGNETQDNFTNTIQRIEQILRLSKI